MWKTWRIRTNLLSTKTFTSFNNNRVTSNGTFNKIIIRINHNHLNNHLNHINHRTIFNLTHSNHSNYHHQSFHKLKSTFNQYNQYNQYNRFGRSSIYHNRYNLYYNRCNKFNFSSATGSIVPILPTILFTIPLSIPYFLILRLLLPTNRKKSIKLIKLFINLMLILVPTLILFSSDITPNTNRHRFMILWPWEEKELLNQSNECVEIMLGSESIIPDDDPRSKLVQHILNRLWKYGLNNDNDNNNNGVGNENQRNKILKFKKDKLKMPKVYLILNDDTFDGIAYPSSVITLTTCCLRFIDYDHDLLAAILAHELAHIIQNHAVEFYGMSALIDVLNQLYDLFNKLKIVKFFNNNNNNEDNSNNYYKDWLHPLNFLQNHSQTLEREADLLGQEIMARAGYDPSKAIELWELMVSDNDNDTDNENYYDINGDYEYSNNNNNSNNNSNSNSNSNSSNNNIFTFKYHPDRRQRIRYLAENLTNLENLYQINIINHNKYDNDDNDDGNIKNLSLRKLELTIWAIYSSS